MRLARAIDRYLDWRALERDATPQSLRSYYQVLAKLCDDHPDTTLRDFEGRAGTEKLRATLARHWGSTSAATRAGRISIIHSFFDWLESEDLIDNNPSRRIRRPPTRKPNVYRPTADELAAVRKHAHTWERPPVLLMGGMGLRASEVCSVRWRDIDLTLGRLRVQRKGGSWQTLPIQDDVLDDLRGCHQAIDPDPDWHVFVVKQRRWANATHRIETIRDPFKPAGRNSLFYLLERVCKRAGIRQLGPHKLRHGYAMQLRRDGLALDVVQWLMGHKRIETTKRYLDELRLEEVEMALRAVVPTALSDYSSRLSRLGTPDSEPPPEGEA